ncbi:MAG: DUF4143 domain-containing protein [Leptospiraceae bacterium]|nr:DUF4143 domain-containing protein [Leptospiraceae bacterium]MCP5494558.1 DUF4143 domain-containing protein [Leptospiraceae bacterium]
MLKEYLAFGGLPRVALAKKHQEKIELIDDIYKTYLLQDVRNFIKNQDTVQFNNLLKILSSQIGNMVNSNELSNTTQLSYTKCEEYIYLMEQMYIIKLITPFTTNKRREITKMKKLYFLDIGLRNMIYNSFNDIDIRVDNGSIFENFVFLELLKVLQKPNTIQYYRTKHKRWSGN